MKLEFTVDGKPIGKARPRVTKRATYTPATTTRYEDLVRYAALNNLKEDFEENEPLSVEVIAFFEVPKSYSRNKKTDCLAGWELPTKMPDADNIGKIIMDGMNPKRKLNKQLKKIVEIIRGVYQDDRQVTKLLVVKRYSESPRVEVRVKRDTGELE